MSADAPITISSSEEDGGDEDDDIQIVGEVKIDPTHVFLLDVQDPVYHHELVNRIKSLGGQCLTEATTYESRATHCVIVSKAKGTASYTPKALGCLATGRHLLTANFVLDSCKAGKFLDGDEGNYLPGWAEPTKAVVNFRGKKLFSGWKVAVILRRRSKKNEIEHVLADGGAQVFQFTPERLIQTDPRVLNDLTQIFTEPSYLDNHSFKLFMSDAKKRNWQVRVYSYFFVWKYIIDGGKYTNHSFFSIENPSLVAVLHAPKDEEERPRGPRPKRRKLSPPIAKEEKPALATPPLIEIIDDDEVKEVAPTAPTGTRKQRPVTERRAKDIPVIKIRELTDVDSSHEDDEVQVLDSHEYVVVDSGSDRGSSDSYDDHDDDDHSAESSDGDYEAPADYDSAETVAKTGPDSPARDDVAGKETESPSPMEGTASPSTTDVPPGPTEEPKTDEAKSLPDSANEASMVQMDPGGAKPKGPTLVPDSDEAFKAGEQVSGPIPATNEAPRASMTDAETSTAVPSQVQISKDVTSITSQSASTVAKTAILEEPIRDQAAIKDSSSTVKAPIPSARSRPRRPLYADVTDRATMKRVLQTIVSRQKKTNECIDVENVRARSIRFNENQDYIAETTSRMSRKLQTDMKKSVMTSTKAIAAIDTYQTFDNMLDSQEEEDRIGGDLDPAPMHVGAPSISDSDRHKSRMRTLLNCLEELSPIVDSRTFPQAKTMNTILIKFVCDPAVSLEVAHSASSFFNKVLCLHPPTSPLARLYYLSFLRLSFEGDINESTGSPHLWQLYKHLLDTKNLLALNYVTQVMQSDLEYYMKHDYLRSRDPTVARPLIHHLFACKPDSIAAEQALRTISDALLAADVDTACVLLRALSLAGLLFAILDRERRLTEVTARDSLKAKVARIVSEAFAARLADESAASERVYLRLRLLRPSWLGLLVSSNMSEMPFNVADLGSVLKMIEEKDPMDALSSIALNKMLDTVPFHVVQRTMAEKQSAAKEKLKVPYSRMSVLSTEAITSDREVRFDSGVSVSLESVSAGVDAINRQIKTLVQSFADVSLAGDKASESEAIRKRIDDCQVHAN